MADGADLAERMSLAKEAKLWVRQNQKPGQIRFSSKEGFSPCELPPLLEARRLEHGIPDGAFRQAASFNRILLWQLPQDSDEVYSGTRIIKTAKTQDKERDMAPTGVIVSAGLSALDYLRSNGMDLGHIVAFVRLSPYRFQCDIVGKGIEQDLKILQSSDIIASFDLARAMAAGRVRLVREVSKADGKTIVHKYADENGETWEPQDPRLASDY